jgi:hypothetical protein
MKTQHTPAPWSYDEFNGKLWITDDTCIGTIAQLVTDSEKGNWDEDKANARLIAAAPELLAALQEIESRFCTGEETFRSIARAAIAKATT